MRRVLQYQQFKRVSDCPKQTLASKLTAAEEASIRRQMGSWYDGLPLKQNGGFNDEPSGYLSQEPGGELG